MIGYVRLSSLTMRSTFGPRSISPRGLWRGIANEWLGSSVRVESLTYLDFGLYDKFTFFRRVC